MIAAGRRLPTHIDPVTHVGGLVLNAGHATDHHNTIYVMHGWKSMRFAEELVPGELYRSYVKMNLARNGSGLFLGDVYVLRGDRVIGKVREMALRPLHRILMNRFFDPPGDGDGVLAHHIQPRDLPQLQHQPSPTTESSSGSDQKDSDIGPPTPEVDLPIAPCEKKANTQLVRDALALLAAETGVEPDGLTDETEFSTLGIDSLLSLVLVEKFSTKLQVDIQSSIAAVTSRGVNASGRGRTHRSCPLAYRGQRRKVHSIGSKLFSSKLLNRFESLIRALWPLIL
ncbi:hypothetical protein Asppvi_000626 [Aspergillus pseudoviridinutans]|uniref:Carrier domain-containing protein n=1 Tax=Aspergillus pseudoviridinutans TaxID=1517512 RepID=A0A9P3B3R2_9EURO|nr:uncharacterized protein Asppvi_000626 [Aspergillus pseudoviridinutans]GIJ82123.1 hypothetical protein Asppvi_000626 [Aspergillus pseudoviridinutans]